MYEDRHHANRTRTVLLPSGRRVVVNYVDQQRTADAEHDLHVCGGCDSHLVHPLEWEPVGASHWQVLLRCPDCEWEGTGVFDEAEVHRFDDTLEEGIELLRADLRVLERANMHDFAERFTAALHADLILPEDF